MSSVAIETPRAQRVTFDSIGTSLVVADGEIQTPVTVAVEGGAMALTDKIAVGGVSGTLTASDLSARTLTVNLAGGFEDTDGAGADGLWSLTGDGRSDRSSGKIVLQIDPFELGKVPEVLAKLPVVSSEKALPAHATRSRHRWQSHRAVQQAQESGGQEVYKTAVGHVPRRLSSL